MRAADDVRPPLLTVGHGTAGQEELLGLLRSAGVESLVDVRTAPGSRVHPHVAREALAAELARGGVHYRWEPRLGGFRRPPPDSPDPYWRNSAFRGYAAHLRSPEARAALDELLARAAERRTTVMCSESLWWRCHRRLIADVAVLARAAPDARWPPVPASRLARRPGDGAGGARL